MAIIRITEKTAAQQVKTGAHILITQPETVGGQEVEALRRATMAQALGSAQTLTEAEKAQARVNVGAEEASATEIFCDTNGYIIELETADDTAVAMDGTTGLPVMTKWTSGKSYIGACSAGDQYSFFGRGRSDRRCGFMFIAADGTILAYYKKTSADVFTVYTAPENAAFVYFMRASSGAGSDNRLWKGTTLPLLLSALDDQASKAVHFDKEQALTNAEKAQARTNIGAAASSDVTTLSNEVKSRFPDLPSYYHENNYIEQKAATIRTNMSAAGKDSFSFVFFTDPHWGRNARQSPKLIRYILDNTPVNHVVCGGDLIAEGTHEYAVNLITDCVNSFRMWGVSFPVCIGNHDRNWNPYETQRSDPTRKLTDGEVWALIEAQYDKHAPVYFGDPDYGFNFYVDYPESNTRLIFIDTGDTRESSGSAEDHTDLPSGETEKGIYWRDYEVFGDALMDAGNKRIIVIVHAIYMDPISTGNAGVVGTRLCKIAKAYNQRTNGSGTWYNYDFTNAQGRVYLVVGGHSHNDKSKVDIDPPWFMTDCDALQTSGTNPATEGTVTEQAFDVITVNYRTGDIKLTRIGRGEDREYTAT